MNKIPILEKPDDMHPNRWQAYLTECRNRGQFYIGQLGGYGVARIPINNGQANEGNKNP